MKYILGIILSYLFWVTCSAFLTIKTDDHSSSVIDYAKWRSYYVHDNRINSSVNFMIVSNFYDWSLMYNRRPVLSGGKRVVANVVSGQVSNYDHAGLDYNLLPGDTLEIDSIATSAISLGNITGTISSHIVIVNKGKINTGVLFFKNFRYVDVIFSDPISGYGLRIANNGFRAVNIDSAWIGCRLHGIDIYNNGDYAFFSTHTRNWTGNIDDANHDNLFDSIRVVKSSGGWWFGNPTDGFGFWVNCEFKNFRIDSLNESTFWHANDCFKWSVHDNIITNNSLGDSTDAGIIDIHGSVNFYNNYIYNYSGSIVRWHGISLVANKNMPEDTSFIYNNVAKVARKYGGVQINTLASDTGFSYIRPGSIWVAFNSFSKFYDLSYWVGPPAGGGGVPCDHYWCFGRCDKFQYNSYDSMHYEHGQNVAVNYLIHDGTGQPFPDTTGNIRVINPRLTYLDTLHNIPFLVSELTGKAVGLPFANTAFNGVARPNGTSVFVGAYNFLNLGVPTSPTLIIRRK